MPRAEIPAGVESWTSCDECGWSLAQGHLHYPPITEMLPVGADCPACEEPLIEAIDLVDLPKLHRHWLEQLKEELVEDAYCVEEFLRKVLSWEGAAEDELAEAIESAEKLAAALDPSIPIEEGGDV